MNSDNIIKKSLDTAIKSGITGYSAMSLQVLSLMWLSSQEIMGYF